MDICFFEYHFYTPQQNVAYNMENKVPTPNFSSKNSEVEYFKYAPVSKWGFESFKKHIMKKRLKPNLLVICAKYKHCISVIPSKRVLEEIEEGRVEIPRLDQSKCPMLHGQNRGTLTCLNYKEVNNRNLYHLMNRNLHHFLLIQQMNPSK